MEVTHHVVQFDVDPGTFPLLDVGPAGCEQRFDIGPVDTGLGGPHEDRLQGLAVFLPHTYKISYKDIIIKGLGRSELGNPNTWRRVSRRTLTTVFAHKKRLPNGKENGR